MATENHIADDRKKVRLIDANTVYEMGHRTPFHIGIADLCDLKELFGRCAHRGCRGSGAWAVGSN